MSVHPRIQACENRSLRWYALGLHRGFWLGFGAACTIISIAMFVRRYLS